MKSNVHPSSVRLLILKLQLSVMRSTSTSFLYGLRSLIGVFKHTEESNVRPVYVIMVDKSRISVL